MSKIKKLGLANVLTSFALALIMFLLIAKGDSWWQFGLAFGQIWFISFLLVSAFTWSVYLYGSVFKNVDSKHDEKVVDKDGDKDGNDCELIDILKNDLEHDTTLIITGSIIAAVLGAVLGAVFTA